MEKFEILDIDKIIIKCWGDSSDINTSYYMSLKKPFICRIFI